MLQLSLLLKDHRLLTVIVINQIITVIPSFLSSINIQTSEIEKFNRILNANIYNLPENQISSTSDELYTFEASIWCLLTTNTFK